MPRQPPPRRQSTPPPSAAAPGPTDKPLGKTTGAAAVGKAPHAPGTSPEAGIAGAGAGLPLPHERDEDNRSISAEPQTVMEQAKRDIDAGLVDTDLRNAPGLDGPQRDKLLGPADASARPDGLKRG